MTRKIPYEPPPASVLLGLVVNCHAHHESKIICQQPEMLRQKPTARHRHTQAGVRIAPNSSFCVLRPDTTEQRHSARETTQLPNSRMKHQRFVLSEMCDVAERLGSGGCEQVASVTRQIPYEPPACIRFVRRCGCSGHCPSVRNKTVHLDGRLDS